MPRKSSAPKGARATTDRKPTHTDQEAAKRLRATRISLCLSQEEAGERVGISHQQVQKYEAGKSRPPPGRLQQFADAYGVPVATFFSSMDHAPNGEKPESLSLVQSRTAAHLLRLFETIRDPKVRSAIVTIAEAVVDGAPLCVPQLSRLFLGDTRED